MFATYTDYAIDLAVDLVAIFVMAYVLYFRRHRRADLLLAYVTLNIGIFVAMSLLSTRASGHRAGLRAVRDPVDHPAAVQHGDPAGGGLLLRRAGHGPGQRDEPERPLAGRRGERAAAADHVRGGQPRRCASAPGAWRSPWTRSTPTTPRWSPTWSAGSAGGSCTTWSTRSTTCATPWSSTCATGPVRAPSSPSTTRPSTTRPSTTRPQYDQQQYAQQQYGQPQYAQQAQVQYGQPQYAQVQYGQPQYGQPVMAAQR